LLNNWFEAVAIITTLIIQVFIPGFPKEILLIQAGSKYGLYWGSIINWIGMVFAAQVGYEVVRNSVITGGKFSKMIADYQQSKWLTKLEEKGNYALFFLRLIPYAPNDVLSLLSGSLLLPRRGFIIVSMITAIPYAIIFAYVGNFGASHWGESTVLLINFGVLIISIGITLFFHFYHSTLEESD